MSKKVLPYLILASISLILGLLLQLILGGGNFWRGWLAYGSLLFLALTALYLAWRWAGSQRWLGGLMLLAFLLPLFLSVAFTFILPAWGYDEKAQQAGYFYYDAYRRDRDAWAIARDPAGLGLLFQQEFLTDQYGGLLALSATTYYIFSYDVHRPLLIVILGAAVFALGLAAFARALVQRWDARIAFLACLIYALYPDAVFLASSQMREPFLIGFGAIAFWAALTWRDSPRKPILPLILSLVGFALLSSRLFIPFCAFTLAVWVVDNIVLSGFSRRLRILLTLAAVVIVAAAAILNIAWLEISSSWDFVTTLRESPWMQTVVSTLGEQYQVPIVTLYGLAVPVLPAALTDSALPLWQGIAILRALSWYALIPCLLYGFFAVWKSQPARLQHLLILIAIAVLGWVLLASLRGGGDLWDNPRYRAVFIPEMALLAAWAWTRARMLPSPWLWRWGAVVLVFVLLLTNWYLVRNLGFGIPLPIFLTLGLTILLGAVILFGGWLWDRRHAVSKG